jgi:uncharacterized membrane protein
MIAFTVNRATRVETQKLTRSKCTPAQGRSTFYVVRATLAKFDLAAGNMKLWKLFTSQ